MKQFLVGMCTLNLWQSFSIHLTTATAKIQDFSAAIDFFQKKPKTFKLL